MITYNLTLFTFILPSAGLMASALINRCCSALHKLEETLAVILWRRFPPQDHGLAINCEYSASIDYKSSTNGFNIKDIIGDGFLWGVPVQRRTLEKRWKRRFGHELYNPKILKPKLNLKTCKTCGDDHEAGFLCPTCYDRIIEETKLMQDKIQETLQLSPVENEVVVLYDKEKDEKPAEFWKGKRIVEMDKPRPAWYSKNLTQQTTQPPATTKDVKPGEQLA